MRLVELTYSVKTETKTEHYYIINCAGYTVHTTICKFHGFSTEGEEGNTYTVAILERKNGRVIAVPLDSIVFISE